MRNIAIAILSVVLAAAIISGLILYQRHLDTKASLLNSEKSLVELNEKVAQLKQEASALHNQIQKSVQESITTLENTIKMKDQSLSEFKEKIHSLEQDLEKEKKAKDAMLTDFQERLKSANSQIHYLEAETAKAQNEIKSLQRQLIDLKGQKVLSEADNARLKSTYESLISDLKKQIENQEITIKKFRDKISVTLVDRILFEFGKASITSEGEKILEKVGEILKTVQGKQIRIVGHTDNIPIMAKYRYKFPSNWELSAARAAAVIRYFQNNIHLDPKNLEAVGQSFYEPIASNETSQGRAQNRRVEIIIFPQLQ